MLHPRTWVWAAELTFKKPGVAVAHPYFSTWWWQGGPLELTVQSTQPHMVNFRSVTDSVWKQNKYHQFPEEHWGKLPSPHNWPPQACKHTLLHVHMPTCEHTDTRNKWHWDFSRIWGLIKAFGVLIRSPNCYQHIPSDSFYPQSASAHLPRECRTWLRHSTEKSHFLLMPPVT